MWVSLGVLVLGGLFQTSAWGGDDHGGCYIQDSRGQTYDLGELCPDRGEPDIQPVLQTGDIQITLRWDTRDDLDLIVVDPNSNIIDFGSPTSPTGGQLDVNANGFCETHSANPVENIFWPTGAAPSGDYLAYVALTIPCGAQSANAADGLAVPYTLTILNNGVTTLYEGISRPGEFGREYVFQVGDTAPAAETAPISPPEEAEDNLELPTFGLPEL